MKSVELQETSDNSEQPNVELLDSKVSHEGLQILARILARFHASQHRRLGLNTDKSEMTSEKIVGGRPRVFVDFAIILHMRDVDNLGWSRMAVAYMEMTGRYISRDTVKRRYLEAKSQENATIKIGA